MASEFFRFKQFTVWHNQCAMKVGTDGVLLGAWAPLPDSQSPIANSRILDIGTGSGLIALMLAQRSGLSPHIDAIDIDADAVAQATENFALSPWAKQLHAHHNTLQDWHAEAYDLIVSNPPYFQNSLKNPNQQRATARHTDTLSYSELIAHAARLLKKDGVLALVLPIEAEEEILALAAQKGLYPREIVHVYGKPGKAAKRLLVAFSPHHLTTSSPHHPITFYIESADSPRSEEYKALTKDFYL